MVVPSNNATADVEVRLFSADQAGEVAERLMAADDPIASAAGNVEPDSPQAARIAVERLDDLLRNLPALVKRALTGAERNADRLSDDRLQGLAELIQNADDVAASAVTFTVETSVQGSRVGTRLVCSHNGAPLRLRDVVGLGVPWLSMKSEDPSKLGEFGIGLMTLRSLSDTLDVHCGHFHLRFGAQRMSYLTEVEDYPTGTDRQTVFRVPVGPGVVGFEDIETWLTRWGDAGLLFLSSVKSVKLAAVADADSCPGPRLGIERDAPSLLPNPAGLLDAAAKRPAPTDVRLAVSEQGRPEQAPTFRRVVTEAGGARWAVYSREVVTPQVVRRSDKPAQHTTPIAVAFRLPGEGGVRAADDAAPRGMIHVGLPVREITLPFRICAPFEPLANRRDLVDGDWNEALIGEVSDLWCRAAVDLFERSSADAWRAVPLASELDGDQPLAGRLWAALAEQLLTAARTRMAEAVTFSTGPGSTVRLDQTAVEHPDLTGVVGPAEIAELTDGLALLPEQCRDRDGRWRDVLAELKAMGALGPREVEVSDALQLLRSQHRAPELMAALTAAALEHNLASDLEDLWSVATVGGAAKPSSLDVLQMLTDADADPIWRTLGIGLQVESRYAASPAWERVSAWLADNNRFAASASAAQALSRLSNAGNAGRELAGVMSDEQAQGLRAVMESLDDESRTRLGPGIGSAVRFEAVTYDAHGQRHQTSARPCEAYLIDREADSWFVAAGQVSGLLWLHRRYADLLRSPAGRSGGVGAQRLFRLLGAESAPRLIANPRAEVKYQGQARAVPFGAVPDAGRTLMRALEADYLVGDTVSPDLDEVLASIALQQPAAERRRRANAVLASLSRAWERMETEAQAVKGYYSWNLQGEIPATWVLRSREVTWLSNGHDARRTAADLAARTPGTVAILGTDSTSFLHPSHDQPSWREVLLALGVRGDPKASDLITELRQLRTQTLTERTLTQAEAVEAASPIYEALAAHVDSGTSPGVGDMPHRALVTAFSGGDGLIATEHGWVRPNQVLDGPAIFGGLRPFVPAVTGGSRLWRALGIRPPRAEDAEQVIRELARTKALSSEHRMVAVSALRILVSAYGSSRTGGTGLRLAHRSSTSLDLRKLPAWTGSVWQRARPVFAVSDPQLAEVLAHHVPVWQPGAELHQFDALVGPLRLTRVAPADMTVAATDSDYDPDSTATFQAAVIILQADLALNDPKVEEALTISWDELSSFEVAVCPDLRVRSDLRPLRDVPPLPVNAWIAVEDRTLYVTDADDAGLTERGGMALAALFALTNPRLIALPWLDAWTKASAGIREEAVIIARRQAAETAAQRTMDSERRLQELRRASAKRDKKSGTGGPATDKPTQTPAPPPALPHPPRTLVDPSRFTLTGDEGRLFAGSPPPARPDKRKKPLNDPIPPPQPGAGSPTPKPRRGPTAYTALEKEDVGMQLVRYVLSGDDTGIVDIRNQRNVGADAVDALKKFYELKVHLGAIPDQIHLTDSEVQRALSTRDFFLVLVGNVEDGNGAPEVRIINDPLTHLTLTASGSITFTGVKTAQALQYTLTPVPQPTQYELPAQQDGDPK